MHKNIKEHILDMEKKYPGYMDRLKKVMDFIFSIEDIYDVFDEYKTYEMCAHEDENYTEKDYVAEWFMRHKLYELEPSEIEPPVLFASLFTLDQLIYHPMLRTVVRLYEDMLYPIGDDLLGPTDGKCQYNFMQILELTNEAILNSTNRQTDSLYDYLVNNIEKFYRWDGGGFTEKKEFIDFIRDGSITDRLPKFFEWWEDTEKLLLSLPNEKINKGGGVCMTMLYYDTRGWYRHIEKKGDDEAYTCRETTMAMYAKLALWFAGFEMSNDFLKAMFLAINCGVHSHYLIYQIPEYTKLASSPYRKAAPALADEIIATGKSVIKYLSDVGFDYYYISQIACVMNRFSMHLYDLYERFDKVAEEIRRSINTPEECVKLARIYSAEENIRDSVSVIYENGTVITVLIENYDSKSDEEKKKEAIVDANETVGFCAEFDCNIMDYNRWNEYGDAVFYGYIGGCGGTHYYWSSGTYSDTDTDIARELNVRDATEKNIVDFVFYDPTKDKKSDS